MLLFRLLLRFYGSDCDAEQVRHVARDSNFTEIFTSRGTDRQVEVEGGVVVVIVIGVAKSSSTIFKSLFWVGLHPWYLQRREPLRRGIFRFPVEILVLVAGRSSPRKNDDRLTAVAPPDGPCSAEYVWVDMNGADSIRFDSYHTKYPRGAS